MSHSEKGTLTVPIPRVSQGVRVQESVSPWDETVLGHV